jgi:cold-inducible RNA-binding protein
MLRDGLGQGLYMKIHVGNLPKALTEAELKELIAPFGDASPVELATDRDGQSKGFGFATFGNDDHARAAIAGLDGKDVQGQALKVSEARPRKN